MSDFLNKYKVLHDHQFGFQKGKSTEHAALDLHTNIIKAIEKHEKTCAIFVDFDKAFDTEPCYTSEENGTLWNKRGVVRVLQVTTRKQKTIC